MEGNERLLSCVGGLLELEDPAQLPYLLAEPLKRLIPYDFLVYNEIDTATGAIVTISQPGGLESGNAAFEAYSYQHPLITYYQRTRDPNVLRLSDHICPPELRSLELYNEFLHPFGIEQMIVCTLPAAPALAIGMVVTRERSDFSAEECRLLSALRPYMLRAYRSARERTEIRRRLDQLERTSSVSDRDLLVMHGQMEAFSPGYLRRLGLTGREAEVLEAVRRGARNKAIAHELGITVRTVKKHLERVYEKLGVESRTAALAVATGGRN